MENPKSEDDLKALIAENEIAFLLAYLKKNTQMLIHNNFEKEILLISSRYEGLTQRRILGLELNSEEENRIRVSLFEIVNKFKSDSFDHAIYLTRGEINKFNSKFIEEKSNQYAKYIISLTGGVSIGLLLLIVGVNTFLVLLLAIVVVLLIWYSGIEI